MENPPSIEVDEVITERIQHIFEVAKEYGFTELIKEHLTIHSSEGMDKLAYTLNVRHAKFNQYPEFQMKLEEAAFVNADNIAVTNLRSYSYHGFHLEDPPKHFIRFDYEPFKEKFAPVHINAYRQKWGDHLVYPDDTNLDISKMSCPVALKVFDRYAKDKDDFPTNEKTNQLCS